MHESANKVRESSNPCPGQQFLHRADPRARSTPRRSGIGHAIRRPATRPKQANNPPVTCTPDAIRELFRDRALRHTRQREVVYAALAATKAHPTADELYQAVQSQAVQSPDAELSLATVYNTLDALVEAGLARRVPSGNGPCRYDADVTEHAHLITAEGAVRDLPDDLSRRLLESLPAAALAEIAERMGITIDRVNLQVVAKSRG